LEIQLLSLDFGLHMLFGHTIVWQGCNLFSNSFELQNANYV
jgi:hypothetical protein